MALVFLGRADEGVRWLREAAELLHKFDPAEIDDESTLFVALGMVGIGDAAPARLVVDSVVHRLRAAGAVGHLPFALYVSAMADSRLGRLDSGRASAAEAADLAASTDDLLTLCLALGCLALLEAQRGDEQACRTHAAESLRLRALANFVDIGQDALDGLGLLELSLGRPNPAIKHLKQANRFEHSDEPAIVRASFIDLIEACVRGGQNVPTSFRHLPWFVELNLPASLSALLWRGRALLADDLEFDAYFARALELHSHGHFPFDSARTQLCYGERLRRSGRRRDAREHLEAALDTFQLLGARL